MISLNRVQLRTPENVVLDVELAGIGNRALALAIDYAILSVVAVLGFVGFVLLALSASEPQRNWLAALAILTGFAVYGSYFVFFEALWQGQTPGKRFVHIRVVLEDGRPIGLPQAGLRALLRPLDDLIYLGAVCIILNKREKRIGDWVAGTLVVQEVPPTLEIKVSPEAITLAEQLTGRPELLPLPPNDYAIVQRFLQQRRDMDPEARRQVARRLAEQLCERMAISDKSFIEAELPLSSLRKQPQPTDGPEQFLEAVWLTYRDRLRQ